MENISWLCSNASVGVSRSIRNHRRHRCLVTGALIVCPLCLSLLLTCSSLNVRIWCIQPRKSCGNRDGRVGRTCLARNSRHYARTISDYFIVAKVERCLVIAAVTWMPIRPGLWAEWTYRGHLASEVTSSSDEVNEGRSIQNCGEWFGIASATASVVRGSSCPDLDSQETIDVPRPPRTFP